MTSIGEKAFDSCNGLTLINIGNNFASIGYEAFYGCSKLTKVNISDLDAWCKIIFSSSRSNPLSISHNLYLNDEKITDLVIPNSVISIGQYAFYGCIGLKSVTIPNSVTSIGNSAFDACNTTIYVMSKNHYYSNKDCFKTDQVYGFSYLTLGVTGDSFHPFDVPTVKVYTNGAKMEGVVLQNYDDEILSYEFLGIDQMTNASYYCSPNKSHILYYLMHTAKNDDIMGLFKFTTPSLKLATNNAKIVNKGEAVIAATTNLMDNSPNAGFEWRKNDAPSTVPSKSGEAVVYNGKIEGIIKGLDASVYYKYRPYYKSSDGKYYYGSWVGFDPSDFSYFEPTVYTYDYVEMENGKATLVGYAMQGSDEIISQGFEYWIDNAAQSNGLFAQSSDIYTVEASGQRMTAQVRDLAPNTTYVFRAFVKTSKGTTYGKDYQFTTPITEAIETQLEIQQPILRKGVYNLSGLKISDSLEEAGKLPRGIYIVNGKKMVVK